MIVSPNEVRMTIRRPGVIGPAPKAQDITPGAKSLTITKNAEQHPIFSVVELINNNNKMIDKIEKRERGGGRGEGEGRGGGERGRG